MAYLHACLPVIIAALAFPALCVAQPEVAAAPPAAEARPVTEPPVVDGDVLGDPAWEGSQVLTGFWQTAPDEGEPSSERTEIRIVYTTETLYFGVVCFDSDPSTIVVNESRRDSQLDEDDSFRIILDTYRDRQNGFVFGTNPAGLEYDGQVANEGGGDTGGPGPGGGGGGGRQQGGSSSGFNLNWDAPWRVSSRISELGWSAEFAIPFRSLRYPGGDTQMWGLNFQRTIRRRNESAFWSPLPRQFTLYRLSLAGSLAGLRVPPQRNLAVTPYALGESRLTRRGPDNTDVLGDAGLDVKYSITPSLTLDATVNTDFAQVEVDEEQINLDRFNLFFPEKRPFFLENAGLFAVGSPGEAEVFFSRRIGIAQDGHRIPILGGARVTGRIAGTSVGLLNMQTEADSTTPSNNFSVVRINRELPNRSAFGGIVVNRQATGRIARVDDYNRSYALDGRLGVGTTGLVSGFAANTSTPGIGGRTHAFRIGARREGEVVELNSEYTEVGEGFNPEVGFFSRRGFRNLDSSIMTRFRPTSFLRLQEIRPHTSYRAYWNFAGFQETGFWHIDSHWEFKKGAEIHTGMNVTREGVVTPFEIFPGVIVPTGTYDHVESQLVTFTNESHWWGLRNTLTVGGFFGGDRVAISPSLTLRAGETFFTTVSWNRNDIDLPGGSFITNLVRARLSYSFTPRVFVQSLLQYNDRADIWSLNVRLGWLQRANTGLFVVLNETNALEDIVRPATGRSFVVKFSRMFDLLN